LAEILIIKQVFDEIESTMQNIGRAGKYIRRGVSRVDEVESK